MSPQAPAVEDYPVGTPAFCADPYPTWAAMRERGPLTYWAAADGFVVVGFDAAREVLGDTSRFSPSRHFRKGATPPADPSTILGALEHNGLFHLRPDAHLRIRRLVNPSFSPASVAAVMPRVHTLVHDYLQGLAADGSADLAPLADRLPVQIMGEYLGLAPDVTAWLCAHLESISALSHPFPTPGVAARLGNDLRELSGGLAAEFTARREQPTGDLLSSLVAAADDGDRLDDDELFALVVALLMAGAETTTNLMTLGTLALIEHPEAYAELRADRQLIPAAVDEMVRWSYIGFGIARFAMSDTVVAGIDIPAGSLLMVSVGAALRDPSVVADPDRFDIGRTQPPTLSFGVGARHCLGEHLARRVAAEFFDALADLGELCVDGDVVWREHFVLRGIESLPVRVAGTR